MVTQIEKLDFKIRAILWRLILGLLFYVFATNYVYTLAFKISFTMIGLGLIIISFIEVLFPFFKKWHNRSKLFFWLIISFFLVSGILAVLYFLIYESSPTIFYATAAAGYIGFITSAAVLICK